MFDYNDKFIVKICNNIPFLIGFIVISLSIGFSAFNTELLVSDVGGIVRNMVDIRVTNFYSSGNSNGGTSNWEDYNINNISSSIELPNRNSSITYSVVITNIGNIEMGILDITGLPSNLKYTISNYTLKNKLCDDSNSSKCSLGSITTLNITISYNTNGYNSSNTGYQLNLDFDFRKAYTITYSGFSSVSGLPTTILAGESKNITFTSTTGIPSTVEVNNATGSYTSPTLALSNATNNVVIARKYTVTYVDFTGNTSGLVSSMSASGGTITFNSTTSIPDNVTVTGATGSYISPILTIINVTGDISIVATYSGGGVTDPYVYVVNMDDYILHGNYISNSITLYNTPAEAMAAFYNQPFYFKHLLENDVVVESYVEFVITPEMVLDDSRLTAGTYTLRGGVNESGLANKPIYTANVNALKQAFGENSGICSDFSDPSDVVCYTDISFQVSSDGIVSFYTYVAGDINDVIFCAVDSDGDSRCNA